MYNVIHTSCKKCQNFVRDAILSVQHCADVDFQLLSQIKPRGMMGAYFSHKILTYGSFFPSKYSIKKWLKVLNVSKNGCTYRAKTLEMGTFFCQDDHEWVLTSNLKRKPSTTVLPIPPVPSMGEGRTTILQM